MGALHATFLQRCSDGGGPHFEGVGHAGRALRLRGVLTTATARRLANVQAAFQLLRHVAQQSSADTVQRLIAELEVARSSGILPSSPDATAADHGSGSTRLRLLPTFIGGIASARLPALEGATATGQRNSRWNTAVHYDISQGSSDVAIGHHDRPIRSCCVPSISFADSSRSRAGCRRCRLLR